MYWTPEFYPEIDGIAELSRHLLPRLRDRNFECLVVTSHGLRNLPDKTDFEGIPVHRFHFRKALARTDHKEVFRCQRQIREIKRSFDPDLIHYNFSDPYVFFHLSTAAAHDAPSLVTVHMSVADYDCGRHSIISKLLAMGSWVVGVSEATLSDARRAVPSITERSSVIYNGLVSPDLSIAKLPFDEPRILCLGRLVEEKGFDLAIRAFAKVKEVFPKSRLVIAGDGPARGALEQLAAQIGLAKAVDFLGWVDPKNVPELINRVTVVAVPSRWRETFGLIALQAAQLARPVVAARVGGVPETVLHEQTGLLFEKENEGELTTRLLDLLNNPELAMRLGMSSRNRANNIFNMKKCVDAYAELYEKLIDEHHKRSKPVDPSIPVTS